MSRLELVTECEHGVTDRHTHDQYGDELEDLCNEGSRIPLDPDRQVVPGSHTIDGNPRDVQDVLDALGSSK